MKTKQDYIVISAESPKELQPHVNKYLAKGYEPVGGIAVVQATERTELHFVQAMLK